MSEHLLFAEQTSDWKTWEAPDKAIPVSAFDADLGITYREHRATGSGRALNRSWRTSKAVTGSLSMAGWQTYLGYFVKQALMHDVVSGVASGATGAYLHGFVPDDTSMPLGLSVQALRNGHAQSFKGVLFNRMTINCAAGEEMTLDFDWLARDEAAAGGTWEDDGTAAPAALMPAYFPASTPAFLFLGATLTVGGTPTFDSITNTYTITGGTEYTGIEMAEVAIENNLDARIFFGLSVPRNVIGQDRAVTGRFDLDQSTLNADFYDMYRDGAKAALKLSFVGDEIEAGHNAEFEVIVPNVYISAGNLAALAGGNERRMQSVEFTGLADDNGLDVAFRLVDDVASY